MATNNKRRVAISKVMSNAISETVSETLSPKRIFESVEEYLKSVIAGVVGGLIVFGAVTLVDKNFQIIPTLKRAFPVEVVTLFILGGGVFVVILFFSMLGLLILSLKHIRSEKSQ